MATLDDLKTWIDRDIRPRWRFETTEDTKTSLACRITTNKYVLTITALPDWVGCTLQTRFNTGGHPLYADLPDGKLTESTWQQIVEEIKQMELPPVRGPAL